jgi:hypothetical protein
VEVSQSLSFIFLFMFRNLLNANPKQRASTNPAPSGLLSDYGLLVKVTLLIFSINSGWYLYIFCREIPAALAIAETPTCSLEATAEFRASSSRAFAAANLLFALISPETLLLAISPFLPPMAPAACLLYPLFCHQWRQRLAYWLYSPSFHHYAL